jgi:dTDP-4-dehydrorhamnose 3,5-epimerase
MPFIPQAIPDVILITPKIFTDDRGFFLETYRKPIYEENGIMTEFVQENQSFSKQNTLRGLHFQKPPFAQAKLVRVIQGEVFDVAIDIRPQSPTYGKWVSAILSEANQHQLFIPEGFAHGFYVTSPTAVFVYKCGAIYSPQHEGSIRWDDPTLNIPWPLEGRTPSLSPKDKEAPGFIL